MRGTNRERTGRGASFASDRGMTVAEVVIASLILMISATAVFAVVNTAARNTYRAEQSQVVNNVLQGQMEQLKRVTYPNLGLQSMPTHSNDPANPNNRVNGTTFNLSRTGSNNASLISGGTIAPGPTPFTAGGVRGNIYRYVVWQDDPACSGAQCPGSQDFKLLVVSATITTTASGSVRRYQEIQSAITNPEQTVACPSGGCPASGGPVDKPWTFWLTDTPIGIPGFGSCSNPSRAPITADHLAHNTRGVCGNGLKNSDNCSTTAGVTTCDPGSPDVMLTQPAPLDSQYSSQDQPLYNYSTDTSTAGNKGLEFVNGDSCNTLNTLVNQIAGVGGVVDNLTNAYAYRQIHKWTAPPIPNGFDVLLSGTGYANLWMKTAGSGSYSGRICFWLFYRHPVGGNTVDTPILLDSGGGNYNLNYYSYTQNPWPEAWTEIHVPLKFQLGIHLLPGSRLGLAIGVDGSATGSSGLQFLYDTPSFDSRLEVESTSVLPTF